jgi:hypothetical protein
MSKPAPRHEPASDSEIPSTQDADAIFAKMIALAARNGVEDLHDLSFRCVSFLSCESDDS